MKNIILILCLIPSLLLSSTTIGKITSFRGSADIVNNKVTKKATLGSDLVNHDQIVTYDKTKLQVIFNDETIISIGKNSKFSVDEYVNDGDNSEASFSMFQGAMRTITGKIGKMNPKKFKVKTKTATIGVRGTNFILAVNPADDDTVACTQGAIIVEGKNGMIDVPSGYFTRISANGDIQAIEAFTAGQLDNIISANFGKAVENAIVKKKKLSVGFGEADPMKAELPEQENPLATEEAQELVEETSTQITEQETTDYIDQHSQYFDQQPLP